MPGQLVTDLEFSLTASSVVESGSSGTFIDINGTGVPTVGSTGPRVGFRKQQRSPTNGSFV